MTTITQAPYLMTDLGQSTLYTMRNKNGMQVSATDFGGHLVSSSRPTVMESWPTSFSATGITRATR